MNSSRWFFFSAVMDGLTPEMEKIAEIELGETPEVKKKSLEKLKKLIEQEPDFYPFMDDKFLLMFLRCKKHDVQRTLKALRRYYLFKKKYSRIYSDFLPSELKHVMDANCYANMHFRDQDGRLVAVFRVGHCRQNGVSAEDIFAAVLTAGLLSCCLEASSVCGCVIIFDLKDLTLEGIYRFASPNFIIFVLYGIQDCLPFRLRRIHVVNETALFSIFYNMVKFAIPKKLKERFFLHGKNLEQLHKYVPADILPEELGGKAGPMDSTEFYNYALSQESLFKEMVKCGFRRKSSATSGS